eukprot:gene32839-40536_t
MPVGEISSMLGFMPADPTIDHLGPRAEQRAGLGIDAPRWLEEQLDELLVLAKASFPPPQYELLAKILGIAERQNARTSLTRFRHMLFGSSTETLANVRKGSPDDAGNGNNPDTDAAARVPSESPAPLAGANEKKKVKGHGRNGADAYGGAEVIEIALPDLKSGAACPTCLVIVKVVGQAPLSATVYRLARMRCRLCDALFTAPLPADVSASKYDHNCASMLALLRYGSGMPLHRIEQLQACLHIPSPDATQWEIVETAAEGPRHAYEEMIRQAAHNDDTPARILSLMGERRVKAEAKAAAAGNPPAAGKAINTSGIVSLLGEQKIMLFFTGTAHAGTNLEEVLTHRAASLRAPIQMCDALSANTKGDFSTFLALCLAHGRRNFAEVAPNFPEQCHHVLDVLASVYRHDEETKAQSMSDTQRLLYHRTHS